MPKSEFTDEQPKACPFCGATGENCEVMQDHVACRACGATGPYSSYSDDEPEEHEPESGLELWNHRVISTASQALLKQMLDATNPLVNVDPLELHRARVKALELLEATGITANG